MTNFQQSPQGQNIYKLANSDFLPDEPQVDSSPMLFGVSNLGTGGGGSAAVAPKLPQKEKPLTKDNIKKFVSGLNFQDAISISNEMLRVANYIKYKELLVRLMEKGDNPHCLFNPTTNSYFVLLEKQDQGWVVALDTRDNFVRCLGNKTTTDLNICLLQNEAIIQLLEEWQSEIHSSFIVPCQDLLNGFRQEGKGLVS